MESPDFDRHDPGEVEEVVSRLYSRTRVGTTAERTHTRTTRQVVTPEAAFDAHDYSVDLGDAATPQGYLRRVRLDVAHHELQVADPDAGHTATTTAASGGFAHPGRFAGAYRKACGRPPRDTLHT